MIPVLQMQLIFFICKKEAVQNPEIRRRPKSLDELTDFIWNFQNTNFIYNAC